MTTQTAKTPNLGARTMTEPTEAEIEEMVQRMDQENAEREAAIIASMPPLTEEERAELWRQDSEARNRVDMPWEA